MVKKYNVLSLFNGYSGGYAALIKAGISIGKYYSVEIDKYCNLISNKNYPDIIQLGDIKNVYANDIDKIDILIGGSPCQGFSKVGNRLNFEDPRSKLFFEYYRLLNECRQRNPDLLFLLENVEMKKESEAIISNYIQINPIKINSKLLSAQSRPRNYWTNIYTCSNNLLNIPFSIIPQPKDKNICIKDILQDETEVYKKAYLSIKIIKGFFNKNQISFINSFNPNTIDDIYTYSLNCKTDRAVSPFYLVDRTLKPKFNQIKASCLTIGGNGAGNHSDMDLLLFKDKIRRYTPIECERLQGLPDNYTAGVSDTQRYKMLGNGWQIDTIAYIFSFINNSTNDNYRTNQTFYDPRKPQKTNICSM
jgi:DNA-cytosine methyltransferase